MTASDDPQPNSTWLRHHRILLGVAATAYSTWWFVVETALAGAFNPLPSRLAICASFLAVLALSFKSAFVRRYIDRLHEACCAALIIHYYYLFKHNPGDVNWVVGSYITVVAVGMTIERATSLAAFAVLVLASTWYVASQDPAAAVAIPGMVTVLLLLQIVLLLRAKADAEKQRRLEVEAEFATTSAISRAKSLFLANMSHELRTPLASVIGFTDLLADAEELSSDSKDYLERIRANSQSLMDTVSQILKLTEDDFAGMRIPVATLDLRELLTTQVAESDSAAKAKGLTLTLAFHEPFPNTVVSDRTSLQRLLRNVIGNAIKFTSNGSVAIAASLVPSTRPGLQTLTVTVQDTGIGIDAADLDRVFDPFRQAKDGYARPFGGVGLGLTIARKIARAMDGDVRILSSILGQGTTVEITVEVRSEGGTQA